MLNQTFTVVGITTNDKGSKVRFTDDMVRRIKQFSKGGASRIDFIELPEPMNKIDALRYLLAHPKFQSPDDQATIEESLEDKLIDLNKKERARTKAISLENIKKRPRQDVSVGDVLDAIS